MKNLEVKNLEMVLRVGIFMTFIGHGVLAISGKPAWVPYLQFVGIPLDLTIGVLTVIGFLDIIVGVTLLIKPFKVVILWAVIWTFSTALIRFVSGDPIWGFIERGANWAAPLCLLLLVRYKK